MFNILLPLKTIKILKILLKALFKNKDNVTSSKPRTSYASGAIFSFYIKAATPFNSLSKMFFFDIYLNKEVTRNFLKTLCMSKTGKNMGLVIFFQSILLQNLTHKMSRY